MDYPLTVAQYQQGLSEGKVLGLHCESCGAFTIPPLGVCRNCGGLKLKPTEIESRGVIRTFTVIRVAPEGVEPPYIVALVELVQGSWVIGRIIGLEIEQANMGLIGRSVHLDLQPPRDPLSVPEHIILTFTVA